MRHNAVLLAVLIIVSVSCDDDPRPNDDEALDIVLVQDLTINTTEQLIGVIDSVVVIVDSDSGLYEPSEESLGGALEVRNVDSDDSLELVTTLNLEEDRLPSIRIERGGLADVPVDIRVLGGSFGEAEESPIAEGMVRGITFEPGIVPINIPFNIRPEHLPPRVVDVIPGDGEMIPRCELYDVVVIFSKPMSLESMSTETISIEPDGVILELGTDVSGIVLHLRLERMEGSDTLPIELSISSDVIDEKGRHLDQLPTQEGNQGFEESLTLLCGEGPHLPSGPVCGPEQLDGDCYLESFLECVEGSCLPKSCELLQCGEGFLCSPDERVCHMDCRLYGEVAVCPEGMECSEETGLCI